MILLSGRAYPVAIHAGSCDSTIETAALYDLGFAVPRPIIAADPVTRDPAIDDPYVGDPVEGDPVVGDRVVLTEADFYARGGDRRIDEDTRLIYHDLDGDGTPEYGFDLDDDGTLADDERLESPIVWSFLGNFDDLTGVAADDDAGLADLRDVPHAVVVHAASVADRDYLACGDVSGVAIDDRVVVPLLPVGDQGLTGVGLLQAGAAGFLGIGGDAGQIDVHLWPRQAPVAVQEVLPPTPTPLPPTPTPEPTATPEPTPTPVVFEIPTAFTVELRDNALFPDQFTMLAGTDTDLTVANLTTEPQVFVIDELGVREELDAGETRTIVVNAPVGEYAYGIEGDAAVQGTLQVRE